MQLRISVTTKDGFTSIRTIPHVRDYHVEEECEHDYEFSRYCGAEVCTVCGDHRGLARCYCGWGLGRGERLEDDIGEATFDGENWEVDY